MDKSLQTPTLIGRFTGFLSIAGSSFIVYMILSDRKRKLSRPYHRMMLMMSVIDILQSLSMVFSVTALPQESGIYGAKGNQLTCALQGFLLILGLAVPCYNSCLNIYFVLTIRYNISPERFSKYEYILHAVSILFPLSLAVMSAIQDSMKRRGAVCYPRGKVYFLATSFAISICFLICIVSMICICWTVLSQATKTKKYRRFYTRKDSIARSSRVDNDKNKTIKQACSYSLAFILTYTCPLLIGLHARGGGADTPYAMILLSAILYPLQGFWNFIFYIRPGVLRLKKSNPEKSYLGAIRDVIFSPNSLNMNHMRLLGTRVSTHSLPSNRNVKAVAAPHMANDIIPDASKHVCAQSSSNETAFSKEQEEYLDSDHSVVDIHGTSDDTNLGDITLQVTYSPEVTIMENDIDHQSIGYCNSDISRQSLPDVNVQCKSSSPRKLSVPNIDVQYKSVTPRRCSLIDIGSVLDGQHQIDFDTEAGVSNEARQIFRV